MHYIKGEEYLRKLVAQKLFITRDLRLLAENLARGKIAVTSGIGYSEFQPFIKANLPVVPLPVPKEGLYISGGYGHLTDSQKSATSQCHQGVRQLAAQPRRPGSVCPRHGRGQPAPGDRYQVAERLWRHRREGFSAAANSFASTKINRRKRSTRFVNRRRRWRASYSAIRHSQE